MEARALRCLDALQHPLDAEATPVHVPEDLVVQGVEAHRDSAKARFSERLRLLRQQVGVGRHRQVVHAIHARQPLDQFFHLVAHQRLAAGQPHLARAQTGEHARKLLDLLERR